MAPLAVAAAAPGGALARKALLSRVPEGRARLDDLRREVQRSGATFDGRLRICVVDVRSGKRVVLGAPGSPPATVADAVVASCAIPAVFAPVTIGGRQYVDGGVWSLTNLDAAPATRDTHVLCLDPSATIAHARTPQGMARQALRAAAAVEMGVLRRRGARVWRFGPDRESGELMGRNLMDRRPAARGLAAGYRQGLALSAG
jgi:NTE family protein